jgi:sec-independent protein translocase protein TatB
MFDIGFSELFLIAVVALIVLGPERLPKAARFAGLWVRRARAQWYSVRSELERELATEELQRTLHDTRKAVTDIGEDIRAAEAEARREFDAMQSQIASGNPGDGSSAIDDSTALLDSDDKALLAAIDDIDTRHDLSSDHSASDGSRDVRR